MAATPKCWSRIAKSRDRGTHSPSLEPVKVLKPVFARTLKESLELADREMRQPA
jgi:hypothetical protein